MGHIKVIQQDVKNPVRTVTIGDLPCVGVSKQTGREYLFLIFLGTSNVVRMSLSNGDSMSYSNTYLQNYTLKPTPTTIQINP